jgi:hypothetical protein
MESNRERELDLSIQKKKEWLQSMAAAPAL